MANITYHDIPLYLFSAAKKTPDLRARMTCEESLRAWIRSPPRKLTGAVLKTRNVFWSFPGKDDMRGTPKKEELQNYPRTT